MAACPSCGTASPAGAKFCAECGTPVASAPPPREERRTVTVLFADLAGFTSRAEAMDPEDVRAFLHPWYDLLEREVTGHGGTVERHLGDGIMALFGAPTAHEDDPERAVRAALRITERLPGLGLDLHARLGVNTGEVLFAAATGPGREDAVTGDAVNTAARLQSAAAVDTVLVGEATYRATSRLFNWEAVPPVEARGKADPVPAWRPLEPVARMVGELATESTPFVGRDFELQTLVRLFERSRSTPGLEAVTVVADPGIGKSRLVRELGRYVDALPDLVTWRVGRCLPYGEGIGFWALSEIVKASAGILDTDDQVTLGAKLDAVLSEPDPPLRAWMKDRLAPLVGLETTTQPPQQEEAFTAWRRFLESIAQGGPLVLVVEDLHWADAGFVAFLRHLATNTAGLPVLLLATARPEVEERHPAWLAQARHATVISLNALADRDMTTLLEAAFPDASPELAATILERAAGSPLYAEQLAAMARDRPAGTPLDAAAIPPTIAALLASRIDALPADAKAVLLDASVVGKTFWPGAVAAPGGRGRQEVEPLLAELARRDLVRPVHPSSMADEQEFAFVHALVRDVAYGELTRAARARRHVGAARWLIDQIQGAGGEYAEWLARHFATAASLARDAGDRPLAVEAAGEAVGWLRTAGGRMLLVNPERSTSLLKEALDLAEPGDPRRPEILGWYGEALLYVGSAEEAERILGEAAEALLRDGNLRGTARAMTRQSSARHILGIPGHTGLDAAAVRVLEQEGPPDALVDALCELAQARAVEDDIGAGLQCLDRARDVAVHAGIALPPAWVATHAELRLLAGDPGAMDDLGIAAVPGPEGVPARAVLAECSVHFAGPRASLATQTEFEDQVRAMGFGAFARRARVWSIASLLHLGRWADARSSIESIREVFGGRGSEPPHVRLDCLAAPLAVLQGQTKEAARIADRALASARAAGFNYLVIDALIAAARAADATGNRGQAVTLLTEIADRLVVRTDPWLAWSLPPMIRSCAAAGALDLGGRLTAGTKTEIPVAHLSSMSCDAALAEGRGEYEQACDAYAAAAAGWAGFGVPAEEAYALAGLGRCQLALGDRGAGVARLREARSIWERLGSPPGIAEIDEILAGIGEGT